MGLLPKKVEQAITPEKCLFISDV